MMMRYCCVLVLLLNIFSAQSQIQLGAERVSLYKPMLDKQRVAVVANQASLVGQTHLVDTLRSLDVQVVKIFSPEHGFRGQAEAGASVGHERDPQTGLSVISLYGKNKKPQAEQLRDVDIVLFDLQDVGVRFYTYISTLHYVMQACAERHIPLIVLDRPNPHAHYIDGPVLDTQYRSFVGMHPVPVVYGMTIGEYAQMIQGEGWLGAGLRCDLHVIPLEAYRHSSHYELAVAPSPNLPNAQAVSLYPSLCFFEGTPLSVGRGTSFPFQTYGHPDLKTFPLVFTPKPIAGKSETPPQNGLACHGEDLRYFLLEQAKSADKLYLNWLIGAYKAFPDSTQFFVPFFDLLAGTDQLRKQIQSGSSIFRIRASWRDGIEQFKLIRAKYLLYAD